MKWLKKRVRRIPIDQYDNAHDEGLSEELKKRFDLQTMNAIKRYNQSGNRRDLIRNLTEVTTDTLAQQHTLDGEKLIAELENEDLDYEESRMVRFFNKIFRIS